MYLKRSFAVIGGDTRQSRLVRQLRGLGYSAGAYRVPDLEDSAPDLPGCVQSADILVLPMPALAAPDVIRTADGGVPLHALLRAAKPDALICGGMLGAAENALRVQELRFFDYAKDEILLLENAELTAEAALPLLLERLSGPLAGSRVLICGFGRIGKLLARKLCALGADVSVSARKPAALALARILGLRTEQTGIRDSGLAQYDAIVNTVPAEILSASQLACVRQDCVLLELASLPGGFCSEAQARPGYLAARGLPGRYAPDAAAAIIRRAIFRELRLEETP